MNARRSFLQLACLALPVLVTPGLRASDPAPSHPPAAAPAETEGDFSGKVVETITTAGYTYVQVDTGAKKLWAAATKFNVARGDSVKVVGGMPMANFHSKSLNRDFELIYFTGAILNLTTGEGAGAEALPPGHPPLPGTAQPALPPNHPPIADQPTLDLAGITRVEGGRTVQEICVDAAKLAGQQVRVRGRVVKYNQQVLGRNWLHLRDGTGSATGKTNDLTVTTAATVKVGDLVVVTGTVATDKDFGSGYRYAVIVEDATVKPE